MISYPGVPDELACCNLAVANPSTWHFGYSADGPKGPNCLVVQGDYCPVPSGATGPSAEAALKYDSGVQTRGIWAGNGPCGVVRSVIDVA